MHKAPGVLYSSRCFDSNLCYHIPFSIFFHVLPLWRYHNLLHNTPQPVDHSYNPAAEYPIQDHRSGNCKNLAANAEDLSLCLEFNCRGYHRIGKSRNRNDTSGSAKLPQLLINIKTGQDDTQQN